MQNPILFQPPIREVILNFKTNEECLLESCNSLEKLTDSDIDRIINICNQKPVYDFLFKEKLKGAEYGKEQAEGFIKWATLGWQEQSHFVFLIRRRNNQVIGAIDIKSNNLTRAEIGYWADSNFPGIMSNAVSKLVKLAKLAGFKSLFATTKLDNQRSQNILTRNHFLPKGEVNKPDVGRRLLFEREF